MNNMNKELKEIRREIERNIAMLRAARTALADEARDLQPTLEVWLEDDKVQL